MSDFSDKPLVAGSLIGLRAFDVDRLGRLVSPSYPTIFAPGENVATCKKRADWMSTFTSQMLRSVYHDPTPSRSSRSPLRYTLPSYLMPTVSPEPEAAETEAEKPSHTAGILECTCGWYAYFDGGNDYKDAKRITAIVEGWGICTLGSRGYRAQKMRLVALVSPGRKATLASELWSRVQHNYGDVPVYDRKSLALDAHPLTPPALPTPETAPDFWTRGA